jgi:hypothetical protein
MAGPVDAFRIDGRKRTCDSSAAAGTVRAMRCARAVQGCMGHGSCDLFDGRVDVGLKAHEQPQLVRIPVWEGKPVITSMLAFPTRATYLTSATAGAQLNTITSA